MEGLKTRKRVRVWISVNCPICKIKVQKRHLKRHQRSYLCSLQNKKKTKIPVIMGPDFVRKELEKRRLIEQSRENRKEDKRVNDMGNVSHLRDPDDEFGSIAITGGREYMNQTLKVICPICKREVHTRHLKQHQRSYLCSLQKKKFEALFKEKETICS